MPSRSVLARAQKISTLSIAAASIGWAVYQWPRGPALALGGAVAIALCHLLLLACQFTTMVLVNRLDARHRPSALQVLRAWLAEAWYAALVFGWRQPFAWRRYADTVNEAEPGHTGIVFIHGFMCNRGFWSPWLQRARQDGIPYIAVNLEPIFGAIDDYVPIIDDAVRRLSAATGRAPLLVCHSMGGLAARAWLRATGSPERVAHIVTIGSPHAGTWLARFSHTANGRQMRLNEPWLHELGVHTATLPGTLFTCWYTNCDNVVFPTRTATLPGADNRFVPASAHVDVAFHPEVLAQTLAMTSAIASRGGADASR